MLALRPLLLLLFACIAAGCNLSSDTPVTLAPTSAFVGEVAGGEPPDTSDTDVTNIDATDADANKSMTPIMLTPLNPVPTLVSTQSPANEGRECEIYTTYSGVDPANTLSLRAQPSAASTQLLRVPNNVRVFLLPEVQEIEAEGYHWRNVIYVDPLQNRYSGWMARDSYMAGGIRNPTIATLRPTGEVGVC